MQNLKRAIKHQLTLICTQPYATWVKITILTHAAYGQLLINMVNTGVYWNHSKKLGDPELGLQAGRLSDQTGGSQEKFQDI